MLKYPRGYLWIYCIPPGVFKNRALRMGLAAPHGSGVHPAATGGPFRPPAQVRADRGAGVRLNAQHPPGPGPARPPGAIAAFFGQHPPGLDVRDGAFGGGADGAEFLVELRVGFARLAAGWLAERDDSDAVGAEVAQVSGGVAAGEQVFEPGRRAGVRVVAGAVDRDRPDLGLRPPSGRDDAGTVAGRYQDLAQPARLRPRRRSRR
jgi:hypothetical protein